MSVKRFDTVILGAGAAGMMCAIHAASRGGRVLVVDHAKAPGEKIRISGGGRCNFTNIGTSARNFLSGNPHFAKSALSRYTQHDFVALVEKHGIAYHEKTLGQLFCDDSAKAIIAMLLNEMAHAACELRLRTTLESLERLDDGFAITLGGDGAASIQCRQLVVATGGKSIPKMGASGLGYQIADQFGLAVTEIRPALVPLTFGEDVLAGFRDIAGVAADARVSCGKTAFDEALLFTHRGLSGPAILQISSYWREKEPISIAFLPSQDFSPDCVPPDRRMAAGASPTRSATSCRSGWRPILPTPMAGQDRSATPATRSSPRSPPPFTAGRSRPSDRKGTGRRR